MIRTQSRTSGLKTSSALMLFAAIGLVACGTGAAATGNPTSLSDAAANINITNAETLPVPTSSLSTEDMAGKLGALEQRVGSLEQDMSKAKPTLAKVEVIERQFRSLSLELDRIDQDAQTLAPAKTITVKSEATKPVAPSIKTETVKSEPAPKKEPKKDMGRETKSSSAPAVTGVRFGAKNNNTTRLVVDANRPVRMTTDLDNQEKILVLEIKGLDWKTAMAKSGINSPLIASYTAQNTGDGARLILQLKRGVKLGKVQTLNPDGSNGHRAFVDLIAQ